MDALVSVHVHACAADARALSRRGGEASRKRVLHARAREVHGEGGNREPEEEASEGSVGMHIKA